MYTYRFDAEAKDPKDLITAVVIEPENTWDDKFNTPEEAIEAGGKVLDGENQRNINKSETGLNWPYGYGKGPSASVNAEKPKKAYIYEFDFYVDDKKDIVKAVQRNKYDGYTKGYDTPEEAIKAGKELLEIGLETENKKFEPVQKRDSNGYPYTDTLLGEITVGEGVSRSTQYETARWHTTIEVTPGVYPLYLRHRAGESDIQDSVVYHLPGKITSENLDSLFYGVPFGEDTGKKNLGKDHTYVTSMRTSDFARKVLEVYEKKENVSYEVTNKNFKVETYQFETGHNRRVATGARIIDIKHERAFEEKLYLDTEKSLIRNAVSEKWEDEDLDNDTLESLYKRLVVSKEKTLEDLLKTLPKEEKTALKDSYNMQIAKLNNSEETIDSYQMLKGKTYLILVELAEENKQTVEIKETRSGGR